MDFDYSADESKALYHGGALKNLRAHRLSCLLHEDYIAKEWDLYYNRITRLYVETSSLMTTQKQKDENTAKRLECVNAHKRIVDAINKKLVPDALDIEKMMQYEVFLLSVLQEKGLGAGMSDDPRYAAGGGR